MTSNNGIGKIIQPAFSPAISVLNRMGYTRKFTLLWLMSLVAIAVVTYSLFASLDRVIQPSQQALQGLALIEPVSRTVQVIQLHRGISAALLGGNETMRDRRAAKEREAAEAFQAMEGKLPPRLISSEDFLRIKADWEKLRKEGPHWTADENFAAHTRLIEQLQSFEASVVDDYALILDAELDTYYLIDTSVNKLPHVLEHLGQLRAYGTGILARKQITERQKIKLNNLIAVLDIALNELSINIEKTGRYSPAVRKSLLAAYDGIADLARQITDLVASDILAGHFATPPDVFLDMATAEIDNGYTQMHQVLLPSTKALIEARIARAENTLLMSVGGALLLFLLAVYISVGMYYAIVGSIRSLVRSARTFAGGDLSTRVKLSTRDELSQIGDSFNKMADGFNALLEERKRAEKSLEQESYRNKMLLRTASDGIHILDLDGNVVQVNDAFCRMLGYTETEMLGMNAAQWDAQWTTAQIKANIDALGENASMIKTRHRRRDGSIIDVEIGVVRVDIDGQQLVYCSSRDVTERKRAEDSLRKLSLAVEQSSHSIIITDLDASIEYVNEAFIRTSGYSRAEVIGQNPRLLHSGKNPKATYDDLWAHLARGEEWKGELINRRKDGSEYIESVWISPVRRADGRVANYLAIQEDITERKRAEQALMESRQRAQLYLDTAGVMLIALDVQGRVQMVNRKGCEMLGYPETEILGKDWFDNFLPEPVREEVRKVHTRLMGGGVAPVEYFENDILIGGGDVLTVAWHNSPLLDESGKINGALSSGEDITERKQAERALVESKEKLHAVIETALDAVVQMDAAGIITGWNAQAEKIFGWNSEEAVGRMMHETIIPPQYREAHVQGLKRFLATGEGAILNSRIELSALHRDGHEFPVELAVVPIKTADKHEFSAFIHDITSRKKAEDQIWKQANFDTLTGLPNRNMFYDRLAQEIRKAGRASLTMALLYIDLDHFKEINDTLGHSLGDILLVEAARRISTCVRETDTVARLGGDEFIITLTELNEVSRVDALAQHILHELAEPFRLEGEMVYVSASIGITLYPHDATAVEDMVKNADQAMYAAKAAGRNRFSYFAQSMQQTAQAKLRLISDLRGALAANQFRVYYQPIMELATGRIHKAEALIRWQHPARGMVSPAEFILLAEETGLIVEIGDWVFREAARQAKRWGTLYGHEFQISVNMSPIQFYSAGNPCQAWPVYLRELGLPGQSMVIEITEGLLLNEETGVKDKLLRFHDAGIQISLDDFGTGYSSLSYLQKFDIDFLKIDQSFTRGLDPGSSNMALSEAIITMAHKLGMKVIAEGVETEAQRTLLAAAGCDYGQGYLFSRPVPAGEFEELLKQG